MKFYRSFVVAVLGFMPLLSLAQDRACLIEGTFEILGQKIYSKDCMQSNPKESLAQFKSSCEQLASTSAAFGGAAGKITYMASCPVPAQGVCSNFLGSKRDAYYYARSESDLKEIPASCAGAGGKWRSGK